MSRLTLTFGQIALILLLMGCRTSPSPDNASATMMPADPSVDTPYSTQAQEAARALAQRFAALRSPSEQPPEILWLDQKVERDQRALPTSLTPPAVSPPSPPTATPVQNVPAPSLPDPVVESTNTSSPSRAQLLEQVLADLRSQRPSAMTFALLAAQLSLLEQDQALKANTLAALTDEQRQTVERYQALLVSLHAQLAGESRHVDRRALMAKIDQLLADQPVEIVTFKLCRRVRGFGIYEPFESTAFLAGHDQKMIAYLELDHFRPTLNDQGLYQVHLKQEIELYDAQGLLVWQHEPVNILDTSANLRRDFFTVQMLTLPARLTVGKFHLKARVTDEHTGNRSETSTTLEIVADPSLVRNTKPATPLPAPRSLVP